jgi:hypothetical protein
MKRRPLGRAEAVVLAALDHGGGTGTIAEVVALASRHHYSGQVREALWRLMAEQKITRSPGGILTRAL